jgi:hypothetical protein
VMTSTTRSFVAADRPRPPDPEGRTDPWRARSRCDVQCGVPGVALVFLTDILIGTPTFGDEESSTIGPDIMRSECANR